MHSIEVESIAFDAANPPSRRALFHDPEHKLDPQVLEVIYHSPVSDQEIWFPVDSPTGERWTILKLLMRQAHAS